MTCALLRLISVTCLQLYTTSPRSLRRSAFDPLSVQIPRARLTTVSESFRVRPLCMISLPLPVRHKPHLDSFKSILEMFLFPKQETCHVFRSTLLSSSAPNLFVTRCCNLCIVCALVCAGTCVLYVVVACVERAYVCMRVPVCYLL